MNVFIGVYRKIFAEFLLFTRNPFEFVLPSTIPFQRFHNKMSLSHPILLGMCSDFVHAHINVIVCFSVMPSFVLDLIFHFIAMYSIYISNIRTPVYSV